MTASTHTTRRCRASGTHITIGPAEDRDSGKWETLCEEHGYLVCHDTLALARQWAAWPTWCEECQEIMEARGCFR